MKWLGFRWGLTAAEVPLLRWKTLFWASLAMTFASERMTLYIYIYIYFLNCFYALAMYTAGSCLPGLKCFLACQVLYNRVQFYSDQYCSTLQHTCIAHALTMLVSES